MTTRLFAVCSILILLVFTTIGQADTVTLTLKSASNNDGSVYTYPYQFSINGTSKLVSLMCDDYKDDVQFGESWQANVFTVAQAGANNFMNVANAAFVYEEAAWLYSQALGHESDSAYENAINHAVWDLMDPSAPHWADAGTWLAQAASVVPTLSSGYFDDYYFYTFAGGQPTGPNAPYHTPTQEYIGHAPEPASLVLFGSGLLAIGGALRRRMKKQA